MRSSRFFSIIFTLSLFLLILTAAISLPIYIRPFYYAHIELYALETVSGHSATEIRDAYDAVLDYLTIPGREFSTGVFVHSEAGKAHFEDCKVLFDLNRNVLLLSGLVLGLLLILRKKFGPYRLGNRSGAWWAGLLALAAPLVLGGLAALDFDRAFVIFHSLFFPGKDNWIFDGRYDEIIRVLPQDFFMHCAMLIGGGLLIFSLGILIFAGIRDKNRKY